MSLTLPCLSLTLVETKRVSNSQSSTHLRSELFNKGQVVAVKCVSQVESIK